jgi:hypothetical protein
MLAVLTIHPNILERDGKKAFVIFPYEEFMMMEETIQDFEDLKLLLAAKAEEANAPAVPLADVKKDLDIS